MTLKLIPTSAFKKDLKRAKKQGRNLAELSIVMEALAAEAKLPEKNRYLF